MKVEIDLDTIRIYDGEKELVGWIEQEWKDDPSIVPAIANAVHLATTNPEALRIRLLGR